MVPLCNHRDRNGLRHRFYECDGNISAITLLTRGG
jgi:hypothetical protein